MSREIVIIAGASRLARARARMVAADLRRAWPEEPLEIRVEGPNDDAAEPDGPRGIQALETEAAQLREALLDRRADLVVMAFDERPGDAPEGVELAAVPQRSDPREVMVSANGKVLAYQPEGSRVGTDLERRAGQMLRRRSDLEILPAEGLPAERIARLEAGEYDLLLFSAAELEALDLRERISEYFDHDQMVPAPGQGALAIEVRAKDEEMIRLLEPLNDELSAYAVMAELACMKTLGATHQSALGVHAMTDGDRMSIYGIAVSPDGTRTARMQWSGPWRDAQDLGETLAELLMSIGADKILRGEKIPPTVRYSFRPGGNTSSGLGFGGGPTIEAGGASGAGQKPDSNGSG